MALIASSSSHFAVAVSLAMGWDSLVGLGLSLVSIAWGFTAATFNPFNVVTVQKLADLEVFSGLWLRLLIFVHLSILIIQQIGYWLLPFFAVQATNPNLHR